jgi:hypothetical protein
MTFLEVVIIMFLACNALSNKGSEDESAQETQNALLLTQTAIEERGRISLGILMLCSSNAHEQGKEPARTVSKDFSSFLAL